ncbi:MAG: hypothetical protein HZA14_08070 [Nitrospirae bacterium]|nr:hypothetical protein [Nitrospirota bacterium]
MNMAIGKDHRYALLLISLAGLIVYSNAFSSPFIFDDFYYILDNPAVKSFSQMWPPMDARYVTLLSFAINYAIGGESPFGYHLVNVVIHIGNAMLLYTLVITTFNAPGLSTVSRQTPAHYIALAAAMLFLVHPVQTQAVTYISQRFASLATLFYLSALVLYVRWRNSGNTRKTDYLLAVLLTIAAQKTKEIAFTLPVAIMLYEFSFYDEGDSRRRIRWLAPFLFAMLIVPLGFLAPAFGFGGVDTDVGDAMRNLKMDEFQTLSSWTYLLTQFRVIMTYLRLLILPIDQRLYYDYPVFDTIFNLEVVASLAVIILLLGAAIQGVKREADSGAYYNRGARNNARGRGL